MPAPSSLPPDRAAIRTEHRHEHSTDLDRLDTRSIVDLMVDDHGTVVSAVSNAAPSLSAFIEALIPRMRRGGRLIYIGAGTSGRLGVLDASECPPTFQSDPNQIIGIIAGGDSALRKSSEGKEDDPEGAGEALRRLSLTALDTVVGIAAGGTTPYVLGALRIAKQVGAATALLTCAPPASGEHGDHLIHLDTGPELLTGSTRLKAGSATKLALNIISTAAFVQLGKIYSNLMVDLRATNDKLTDRAIRILIELCPDLDRRAAVDLLHGAEGQLKAAIVMQLRKATLSQARQLLEAADGRLRDALHQ